MYIPLKIAQFLLPLRNTMLLILKNLIQFNFYHLHSIKGNFFSFWLSFMNFYCCSGIEIELQREKMKKKKDNDI